MEDDLLKALKSALQTYVKHDLLRREAIDVLRKDLPQYARSVEACTRK